MKQLDLPWARRCAAEYEQNPTPGRAHNCAQQLGAVLAEVDRLTAELAAATGPGPAAWGGA